MLYGVGLHLLGVEVEVEVGTSVVGGGAPVVGGGTSVVWRWNIRS